MFIRISCLCLLINFPKIILGQYTLDAKNIDSILFGKRINTVTVKDTSSINKNIEIELAIYKIDGIVQINDTAVDFPKTFVKNIYCRREDEKITTLYFVLSHSVYDKLQKQFGAPTNIYHPMIGTVENEPSVTWVFEDYRIDHITSFSRPEYFLIINHDSEATYYRRYEELKKQLSRQ